MLRFKFGIEIPFYLIFDMPCRTCRIAELLDVQLGGDMGIVANTGISCYLVPTTSSKLSYMFKYSKENAPKYFEKTGEAKEYQRKERIQIPIE